MKVPGRFVVYKTIRRLTNDRGCEILDAAKAELNRIIETICLEAVINAKMQGRSLINVKDIRRCPTCDRDRTMGTLKL